MIVRRGEAAEPRLSVSVVPVGPWLTVELRGDLDLTTEPEFSEQVGQLIARQPGPRIALELSQLAFCDSSGLNALIRLWKRAAAAGGQLVLVRPTPRVVNVLVTTGLDRFLKICDALPEIEEGPTPEPV
ncbi:STAS domain-containing protein [Actinomadura sp. 21ATH]|uniref:STAS domain-containing protein n=1 Tax=Actinomadura sp. 21ATH TaxID=1735444 RepID=UPI0035C0FEBB